MAGGNFFSLPLLNTDKLLHLLLYSTWATVKEKMMEPQNPELTAL
jgi:hypothetical protein